VDYNGLCTAFLSLKGYHADDFSIFRRGFFFSENLPDSEEATLISIIKQDVPGLAGPDLRNTIINVVFYIFFASYLGFQLLSNLLFGVTETKRLYILK
jgi:hypothetical protein